MEQNPKLIETKITVYDHTPEALRDCFVTLGQINFFRLRNPEVADGKTLQELQLFFKKSHDICKSLKRERPHDIDLLHMQRFFEFNCRYIKSAIKEDGRKRG